MPRLTGALVTAAGFLPIGFVEVDHRRIRGRHLLDRRHRGAAARGSVSGIFTPYLAMKMLPKDIGQHHHGGDPYDTPFYRKLRGLIDLAIERRWLVIGATVAALALALAGMQAGAAAVLPEQLAPRAGRRPAHEGRLFLRGDHRAGEEDGRRAREGQGRQVLHRLHRRRRAALLPGAEPRAAEPRLRPVRRHDARTSRHANGCARA